MHICKLSPRWMRERAHWSTTTQKGLIVVIVGFFPKFGTTKESRTHKAVFTYRVAQQLMSSAIRTKNKDDFSKKEEDDLTKK